MPQFKSIQTLGINPNEEARTIEGIVSAEVIDKQHEITVQEYLLDGLNAMIQRGVAPIAVQHSNHVAGKWTSFEATEIEHEGKKVAGIKGVGEIFRTPYGDSVWSAIKSGKLQGLSFAGVVRKTPEMLENGERVVMLENKEVWEVSLCEQPAVPVAILTAANTAAKTYGDMALVNHQLVSRNGEDMVLVACKSNVCEILDTKESDNKHNNTNIYKSNEEKTQMKNEKEVEKADNAVEKTESIADNSELVNKGFEQITATLESMSKTQEQIVERLNTLESAKGDDGGNGGGDDDDEEEEKKKAEAGKMGHGEHGDGDEEDEEENKKTKKTESAKGGDGGGDGGNGGGGDEAGKASSDILTRLQALEKAIVAETVPAQKMNTIVEEPRPANKLEVIMKSAGVIKNPMFEDLRKMRREDPKNAMANWRADIRAGRYNHLVGKSLAQRFTTGGYE